MSKVINLLKEQGLEECKLSDLLPIFSYKTHSAIIANLEYRKKHLIKDNVDGKERI